MGKVTVITELGSSPAPRWQFERWVGAAAKAGADAVKVQLWRPEHFGPAEAEAKRPYAFPRERLREFAQVAHAYGMTVGASVFDLDAVQLAAQWCDWLKLAAREQYNGRLELEAFYTKKHVYRSISRHEWSPPSLNTTYLYAIQRYPAPMWVSLWRLWRWQAYCHWLDMPRWGWSSHTTGYLDCTWAARLGATVIEKHLALDKSDAEAGHSLLPSSFAAMCRAIRKGE